MTWSWWGIPGLLVLAAGIGSSVLLSRVPGDRPVNRVLVRVLVLEGLFVSGTLGALFFLTDERAAFTVAHLGVAAGAALPFQYLLFLGEALPLPVTQWFASRRVRAGLNGASLVVVAVALVSPDLFIAAMYSPGWAAWNLEVGPASFVVMAAQSLVSLFGLAAGVLAWRSATPGSAARNRGAWFVVAFGLRDAFAVVVQAGVSVLRPIPFWGDVIYNPVQGGVYLLYVVLLVYAVLNHQLFDIDLRIKAAVRRSAVAAPIASAFLVGSEYLEALLPVESFAAGLLAAGIVALFLRPLNRWAERFASGLMRGVDDTPEYRFSRRLRVYKGALEGARSDGVIAEEERAVLRMLQAELGLADKDVASVERVWSAT